MFIFVIGKRASGTGTYVSGRMWRREGRRGWCAHVSLLFCRVTWVLLRFGCWASCWRIPRLWQQWRRRWKPWTPLLSTDLSSLRCLVRLRPRLCKPRDVRRWQEVPARSETRGKCGFPLVHIAKYRKKSERWHMKCMLNYCKPVTMCEREAEIPSFALSLPTNFIKTWINNAEGTLLLCWCRHFSLPFPR